MTSEGKKEWAKAQLRRQYDQTGTMPKKEDFDEVTRSRIKAFLGPWPRALEAAGLKPSKTASTADKTHTHSSRSQTSSTQEPSLLRERRNRL